MAKIDLSKYALPEQQKLFTILLMNYYSKKKQNRNLKVTKKVRSANLAQ